MPQVSDILLVIEVADTTIGYDLATKVPLYEQVGIPEVWVVDHEGRQVHVFRQSGPEPGVRSGRHRPAAGAAVILRRSRRPRLTAPLSAGRRSRGEPLSASERATSGSSYRPRMAQFRDHKAGSQPPGLRARLPGRLAPSAGGGTLGGRVSERHYVRP